MWFYNFRLIIAAAMVVAVAASVRASSTDQARADVEQRIAYVSSVQCDIEMSRERKKKSPKVKTGKLELAKGMGARVALTRKDETDEYVVNREVVWDYEHDEKEAKFLPTNMPVLGPYVQYAFNLNIFRLINPETLKLKGVEAVEGVPCWRFKADSPKGILLPETEVEVWFAQTDGIPRKIEVETDEGDVTIHLRNVVLNQGIQPSRFQWSPPHGVKVKNVFGF